MYRLELWRWCIRPRALMRRFHRSQHSLDHLLSLNRRRNLSMHRGSRVHIQALLIVRHRAHYHNLPRHSTHQYKYLQRTFCGREILRIDLFTMFQLYSIHHLQLHFNIDLRASSIVRCTTSPSESRSSARLANCHMSRRICGLAAPFQRA